MNLSNYYWYFKSALTPRFCDEVIKYGLIRDPIFFNWIEENLSHKEPIQEELVIKKKGLLNKKSKTLQEEIKPKKRGWFK